MEKKMREYIQEDLDEYINCATQLDADKFMNDVLLSFKNAKTKRHYVTVIPADINEYYTTDEHNSFAKYGYYQQPLPERYSNRFFIPPQNIELASQLLKDENMVVEELKANFLVKIKVVTLNGFMNSHFSNDFNSQPPITNNE